MPRGVVMLVACPKCNAGADERCIGVRGQRRIANHMERVLLAENRYRDLWESGALDV